MSQVTVSSKYQVVIPREVRKRLGIWKGQRLSVVVMDNIIELVPERELSDLKGAFPQLSTQDIRDEPTCPRKPA